MGFGTYLMDIFGPTKAEKSAMDALNSSSGVAVQQGEGDTTAASKWYQDILSGDPTKQAQAIAPQTAAAQQGAQQQKNQAAQFAPRSGGMAATMAGMDANTRAQLIQLLGGLQSGAASGAAGLGTAEQGLSQQATGQQAQLSQEQMQNWANSILGKGITSAAGAAESAGLGAIGM